MDGIVNIISNLGFPIFVACWMLIRGSEDSKLMRASIDNQTGGMKDLKDAIDGLKAHCGLRGTDK